MRTIPFSLALAFLTAVGVAQNESRIQSDLRREGDALKACGQIAKIADCGQTLVLGQPLHIAVGSFAPSNGFGTGLAFVEHKNFANEWRTNFSFDAAATMNGSWRAGGYMKAYRLAGGVRYHTAPLFYLYSQSISLNRVDYYGLGPATTPLTHSTFGFSENVTGIDAVIPVSLRGRAPLFAIVGELNGRFPSVRPGVDVNIPSINSVFTENTAPGLSRQPAFIQPSEGLRLVPTFFKDRIRLDYLVEFQQYWGVGDSAYSFNRFNGDFNHEIPLSTLSKTLGKYYGNSQAPVFPHNGPDYCGGAGRENDAMPCPKVSLTEKMQGSIRLRVFLSESFAGNASNVPFYFSPTIGGSDINGASMLASYPDYRFRGPNLLLFRGTLEHSLGPLPIGALFSADQAKIGLSHDDVSLDHLRHSFGAGLTIRAGGLPIVSFLYSWGGSEGSHPIANVDPALLGSSARPSLF
jgi:hypothetical protein